MAPSWIRRLRTTRFAPGFDARPARAMASFPSASPQGHAGRRRGPFACALLLSELRERRAFGNRSGIDAHFARTSSGARMKISSVSTGWRRRIAPTRPSPLTRPKAGYAIRRQLPATQRRTRSHDPRHELPCRRTAGEIHSRGIARRACGPTHRRRTGFATIPSASSKTRSPPHSVRRAFAQVLSRIQPRVKPASLPSDPRRPLNRGVFHVASTPDAVSGDCTYT